MIDTMEENLEVGEYLFRDGDCVVYVSKSSPCNHYQVTIIGVIGVTGMHYNTFQDLMNSPLDFSKFTYSKYKENQILSVEPIDKS